MLFLMPVAIIVLAVIAAVLLRYAHDEYDDSSIVAGILGVLFIAAVGISVAGYAVIVWHWYAADYKAQIINRKYGTKYTQTEVFYACDIIETVHQLNRKQEENK